MKKKSVEEVKAYWEQRIEKSKDSFDSVLWEGLPLWNKYIDELQMYHLKQIFHMIKPSDKVLDLGCGIGRFTLRLANLCQEVYGIDTSLHAINICRKKAIDNGLSNAKFKVMDVRNLDFDDEMFNFVLSVTCLQFITEVTHLSTAIQETIRVTKKGGKVILLECTTDKRKDEFVVSLPRKEWFKIIKNTGCEIENWYGVDIPLLRKIIFPLLNLRRKFRIEKLNFIDYGLIFLLKLFEYTIPKILKNQSWYTIVVINKPIAKKEIHLCSK